MKRMLALVLLTLAAAGLGPDSIAASIYERAVADTARSEADRQRDAGRKPAAVLEFAGIRPGMTVLDMFSGGGYYTELLARVVGTEGRVFAHTNNAYANFVGDEATVRYAGNRLPNVEMLPAENNELSLASGQFDAIMLVLSYHDIYFVDESSSWPKIDGPKLLAEFLRGLKSGGVLAIVDHYAAPGSPRETGNTVHRIDPQIVIDEVRGAGFELVEQADFLRNPADDYSLDVFSAEVRGKTDRFVLKFRKP